MSMANKSKADPAEFVRVSITLHPDIHEMLQELAQEEAETILRPPNVSAVIAKLIVVAHKERKAA